MENQNLIDALERIKENKEETAYMWLFYNLVNAKLVLPVAIDTVPDENGNVPENAKVKYFSIKYPSGNTYLVTFTNTDYFNQWQQNIHKYHILCEFPQVVKMTARKESGYSGIIIDPETTNVILPNDELLKFLRPVGKDIAEDMSVKAERIITDKNVGLQPVENPPKRLISALKEHMAKDKSIVSAHIMQTFRKGETTPTYILVVDFLGSAKRVFEDIAKVAHDNMDVDAPIGIMPAGDKIAQGYIKNVEPFYKK